MRLNRRQRQYLNNYLMVLPAFLILVLVAAYPLVEAFRLSLNSYNLSLADRGVRFVGLRNYVTILGDRDLRASFGVTFRFTFWVIALGSVLSSVIAGALNKNFFWNRPARTIILLPMLLCPLASGLMWRLILDYQYGVANFFVRSLGGKNLLWLGDAKLAFGAVVGTSIWAGTPFMVLLLLAGLQSLPGELYEAGRIDGASSWHLFSRITVPLMAPIFMIAIMIRTMDTVRTFDMVYALTEGGPGVATEMVSLFAYRTGFLFYDMGMASSASVMLFAICAALSIVYFRLLWRRELA